MTEAKSILLSYASKYGSSQEIAEAIAKSLSEAGHHTSIKPVDQVNSLDPYDVIVLGSSIYFDNWLPEAEAFLKQFEAELIQKKVWIYSVGIMSNESSKSVVAYPYPNYPVALKAIMKRIAPEAVRFFDGKIDPDAMDLADWLVNPDLRARHEDYRDWKAIEAWAKEISEDLNIAELNF